MPQTALILATPFVCFPQGSYSGVQPDQIFSVPDTAGAFRFEVARVAANALFWISAAMVVSWTVWQSNDGGVTWILLGGSTAQGGFNITEGVPSPSSWDENPLLPGTSRLVKLSFNAASPMVTVGQVTAKVASAAVHVVIG